MCICLAPGGRTLVLLKLVMKLFDSPKREPRHVGLDLNHVVEIDRV